MPHDHPDHEHNRRHSHHHTHAPAGVGAAFALGVAMNSGLVAAEIVGGVVAHSVALLADAMHNAGDVLTLLLAWAAAVLARRLPSLRRTYGWGRSSILAALVNAVVVLIGAGAITLEAVRRFGEPAAVGSDVVIWIAFAGMVINGATAWLFSRGQEDLNVRAAFLHMIADVGVSGGVLVSALLIGLTGLQWLDPAISLVIVVVIVAGTWGLLMDAMNLAMDGVPAAIAPQQVESYLRELPGVTEVHDLHIWALSTTETALTAHLVHADGGAAEQVVLHATRELSQRFGIGHATLQMETVAMAATCRLRPADVI